jgi:hypothetical protein
MNSTMEVGKVSLDITEVKLTGTVTNTDIANSVLSMM